MQIRGVAVRRYVSVTRLILKHTYLEVYTDRHESKTALLRGDWVGFLSGNTFMALRHIRIATSGAAVPNITPSLANRPELRTRALVAPS